MDKALRMKWQLPNYTKGEERFNMVSHIAGGAFGILALTMCVLTSALYGNVWGVVSSAVYGGALVILYSISSIYHGLHMNRGKKVMRVLDHCAIYLLIAASYTPITLCAVRTTAPFWAWLLFGTVWALAAMAVTFTAIDVKKYAKLSMCCYIGIGWCVIAAIKPVLASMPTAGFLWLLAGGIAYSVGAVLYGLGKRHRYMHAVFHLFVVLGSILQFICIYFYVLL